MMMLLEDGDSAEGQTDNRAGVQAFCFAVIPMMAPSGNHGRVVCKGQVIGSSDCAHNKGSLCCRSVRRKMW